MELLIKDRIFHVFVFVEYDFISHRMKYGFVMWNCKLHEIRYFYLKIIIIIIIGNK